MNDKELTPWKAAIAEAEHRFIALTDKESWIRESLFATQAIFRNEYLLKIANQAPGSLRNAVTNVAAISGLTLNPALGFAYLVPRDGVCCLDISYKGLIKLATDTGAIKWAQADNVYAEDSFVFNGPGMAPTHTYDPFSKDRGEFQGAYCIAKLHDGDVLCEVMPASEIYEIRDKSELYKKKKRGPWVDFFGEMAKKTVIKRASKTWPKSTGSESLDKAIEVLNEGGEGIDFERDVTKVPETYSYEQLHKFRKLLDAADSLGMFIFQKTIERGAWIDLYNSGEDRKKGILKQKVDGLENKGFETKQLIEDAIQTDDDLAIAELIEGVDADMLEELPGLLGPELGRAYLQLIEKIQV